MKTATLSLLAIGILPGLFLSENALKAQVVAIGHITAEVVESVGATSEMSTDFQLSDNPAAVSENLEQHSAVISLGKVKLDSGKDVACNLTIKPASLKDDNGNQFSMEPTVPGSNRNQLQGPETLELAARAMLNPDQPGGLYQGNYTLVFAYN